MKNMRLIFLTIMFIGFSTACKTDLIEYRSGDIKINIEAGDEWIHKFDLFWGLKTKNSPQIAIWIEDTQGNYLSTIYVTRKAATQGWVMSGNNRRKESLPCWSHARNIQYADGLYLPDKENPLTDGISGATPTSNFDIKISPENNLKEFVVVTEINHSTDFNENYPENAEEGEQGYSGGSEGSGQPSVIYKAYVNTDSGDKVFEAYLAGHSSADGSTGDIYPDTNLLTSALNIVKSIKIIIE